MNSVNASEPEMTFMSDVPKDFHQPLPESDFDRELLEKTRTVGWYNIHIAEEDGEPAFAFTIGHFYKKNHPEIIVIGLPPNIANKLLNNAAIKIVEANEKIEPYKKYTDFTEELSVAFVPVELEHYKEYLGYANWFYGSMPKPFPTLQMVWPDKAGKYPWEKDYDKKFFKLQPILGEMPSTR